MKKTKLNVPVNKAVKKDFLNLKTLIEEYIVQKIKPITEAGQIKD